MNEYSQRIILRLTDAFDPLEQGGGGYWCRGSPSISTALESGVY